MILKIVSEFETGCPLTTYVSGDKIQYYDVSKLTKTELRDTFHKSHFVVDDKIKIEDIIYFNPGDTAYIIKNGITIDVITIKKRKS
jgi:hypothetical protein